MSDKKLSDIEEYFGVGAEDWEYEVANVSIKLRYCEPVGKNLARFKTLYGQSFIEKFSEVTPIKPKQEPEFRMGDEVEVRNDIGQRWQSAIFVADMDEIMEMKNHRFICTNDQGFSSNWQYCYKPEEEPLTLNGKEYTREELEAQRDEINRLLEDMS